MVVLAIGGVDPTGASGLAADLRTLVVRGVHGAPVVSALTVQDASGVRAVRPTPTADLVAAVRAVTGSLPVRAVKVGMLAADQAAALVGVLGGVPIVVDPVLEASAGGTLATADVYAPLLEHATLVTPNRDEARLLGDPAAFVERTGVAVLLKGGHGEGREVVDRLLVRGAPPRVWRHPRLHVRNTRGTGCTLASAIAAGLALGDSLADATEAGLALVDRLLRASDGTPLGPAPGPLLHHRA
jgi:hydroxymethylpyrimidine/phosphomethylpyrimidine kinase